MEHNGVPHAASDGSGRARKVDGREAMRKDHAALPSLQSKQAIE
jgi:hypothetical protein